MTDINTLRSLLVAAEKMEKEWIEHEKKVKKKNEIAQYEIDWTDEKILQIIRNGYFSVEYADDDFYILGCKREFIFGDDSWEKQIYKVKFGKELDEDNEDWELGDYEVDFIMKKIAKKINEAIDSIK